MKITVAVVHLIFATIWLGSAFFYVVLVLPKLRAVDAAQAVALKRSLRATMTPLLMVSALATIVSGLAMMVELHTHAPGTAGTLALGSLSGRRGARLGGGGRHRRGRGVAAEKRRAASR